MVYPIRPHRRRGSGPLWGSGPTVGDLRFVRRGTTGEFETGDGRNGLSRQTERNGILSWHVGQVSAPAPRPAKDAGPFPARCHMSAPLTAVLAGIRVRRSGLCPPPRSAWRLQAEWSTLRSRSRDSHRSPHGRLRMPFRRRRGRCDRAPLRGARASEGRRSPRASRRSRRG
jgi:hypothetical protein